MDKTFIQEKLLKMLTECYETSPDNYLTLPKETLDSSSTRLAIADLRNDGCIEEKMRGVIRFTQRGYKLHKKRGTTAVPDYLTQFAV